ncbi:MAG: RluA family pseudouridine synthase [Lachnospiraceae bacterium]|nr:RluA family pseudouridine synthase [Lachnospiraceae bacterium]
MDENENQVYSFLIGEEESELRVDKYLSGELSDLSRSYIQKLLKEGRVFASGKPVKANYKVKSGDEISFFVPPLKELSVEPEPIPLSILYEDKDLIIINKPKDMVVHPCAGRYSGTLVNGLLYHCKDELSGINGVLRPGIVHRIDKDTTGVLVVCKNDQAHKCVAEQLKEHSITRKYRAIVHGILKEDGIIDAPIGRSTRNRKKMAVCEKNGKRAVTHYRVLKHLKKKYTYIECQLETGRTHQIRVHMASIKHPLLGDTIYGPAANPYHLEGQCLHAMVLGLIHPKTKEYMEWEAPLPQYFQTLLYKLDN